MKQFQRPPASQLWPYERDAFGFQEQPLCKRSYGMRPHEEKLVEPTLNLPTLQRKRPSPPGSLWLNQSMFARKIRVEYEDEKRQRHPCPLKWLDSFSMRNFTNASVFDDTLPTADGRMEIGTGVPLDKLHEAMEDWFRRKSYLPKNSKLVLNEEI